MYVFHSSPSIQESFHERKQIQQKKDLLWEFHQFASSSVDDKNVDFQKLDLATFWEKVIDANNYWKHSNNYKNRKI